MEGNRKKYLTRLSESRLKGDDVLHKQISDRDDGLEMVDLPDRIWVRTLVIAIAEELKKN